MGLVSKLGNATVRVVDVSNSEPNQPLLTAFEHPEVAVPLSQPGLSLVLLQDAIALSRGGVLTAPMAV